MAVRVRAGSMAEMARRRLRSGLLTEMRVVPEFGAYLASAPFLRLAPRGDGHPVLVLPGWGGDDRSTAPLRWYLRERGYWVHGWRLGTNQGPSEATTSGLTRLLASLAERHDRTISLVGWSLGGVYARALARQTPGSVRQVITLGSPIQASPFAKGALAVPSTSIYSRRDAVVSWRLSIEPDGPRRQNVEVRSSHIGLGHHPAVLYAVADRLALPEGTWRPFAPRATLRRLYPSLAGAPA